MFSALLSVPNLLHRLFSWIILLFLPEIFSWICYWFVLNISKILPLLLTTTATFLWFYYFFWDIFFPHLDVDYHVPKSQTLCKLCWHKHLFLESYSCNLHILTSYQTYAQWRQHNCQHLRHINNRVNDLLTPVVQCFSTLQLSFPHTPLNSLILQLVLLLILSNLHLIDSFLWIQHVLYQLACYSVHCLVDSTLRLYNTLPVTSILLE